MHAASADDRDRLSGRDGPTVVGEFHDPVQRTGLEPEVVGAARGAVSVPIKRRAGHVDAVAVEVTNDIDFVNLRLELQVQVINALGPSAVSALGNRRVVLIVAARGHTDVIGSSTKLQ